MMVPDPLLSGFHVESIYVHNGHKMSAISGLNLQANPPLPWFQLRMCGYVKGHGIHLSIISQIFKIPCDTSTFPNTLHLLSLSSAVLLFSMTMMVINSYPLPTPVMAGSKMGSFPFFLIVIENQGNRFVAVNFSVVEINYSNSLSLIFLKCLI